MPNCGSSNFTDIRKFNLMFKTFQGVTEDAKSEIFLRPETAQGIFVNFANVQRTTRKRSPWRGADRQSFRNEITPATSPSAPGIWQMEVEFFCKPGTDLDWFQYWKEYTHKFVQDLGMKEETSGCGTTNPRSSPTTPKPPLTLNTSSRLAGASFGASPTSTDFDLSAIRALRQDLGLF